MQLLFIDVNMQHMLLEQIRDWKFNTYFTFLHAIIIHPSLLLKQGGKLLKMHSEHL